MATQKMPPYPIFNELSQIPANMDPWQMRMEFPQVNDDYGTFIVVSIKPCTVEQHHIVSVIDEEDEPLYGVGVIFGYPGQQQNLGHMVPKVNRWVGSPTVLAGDGQYTDFAGTVRHTTGPGGGEDIWVWYVVPNPLKGGQLELYLSSVIVKNCKSIANINNHTGVEIIFKRQMNLENVAALPGS